ncbi:sensor histidine kinase [Siansivirga zeaxanthinifaciens]|uniref:histidine kinase n=1 Tax=Siansivirga zeaxanthinifaciens CC-SAMT-1 TaxID=1454006 RepID=A0A0C5WF33_9FLAO|nr:ATP-binding protein [Siansivirga zeaxanthinifaciens]AJR04817.1 hypothetical protein AW14_06590 [Siansivirga zeaxanthinifaciens CC-SAMT-1]
MKNWLFFGLLIWCFLPIKSNAQSIDTLFVDGINRKSLGNFASYWVDSTKIASVYDCEKTFVNKKFQHWDEDKTLNLGKNPYPLWLQLTVKNNGANYNDYWWGIYTQADTITFYKKDKNDFIVVDKLINNTLRNNKKVRTRFPATKISLQPNQSETYFVKIENLRNTQNAVMDLTTPEDNLMWEKKFYWQIGFFIGGFLLISAISLILGFIAKENVFFTYAVYLLFVIFLSLREELLVTVITNKYLFDIANNLHSLPLAVITLALHFKIVNFILYQKKNKENNIFLQKTNNVFLIFGVIFSIIFYFFKEEMLFDSGIFSYLWDISIFVIFGILLITLLIIWQKFNKLTLKLLALIIGTLFLYYNPAGYFLNYAGILNYYTITYPNYFYWIVCFEFLLIGCFLAWRYQNTMKNNFSLLSEKKLKKERYYRKKIEIQQSERIEIAKDLHDDLGATISALKLIITNNYKEDKHLSTMITKASSDLKVFFNKLTLNNLDKPFKVALHEKIEAINSANTLKITFICLCENLEITNRFNQVIYKISNELIINIVKHSKAKEATLQIIKEENKIEILAEDDGIGFNIKKKYSGLGLESIKTRVKNLKGTIHISSNSKGSTFIIHLPIKSNYAEK